MILILLRDELRMAFPDTMQLRHLVATYFGVPGVTINPDGSANL